MQQKIVRGCKVYSKTGNIYSKSGNIYSKTWNIEPFVLQVFAH